MMIKNVFLIEEKEVQTGYCYRNFFSKSMLEALIYILKGLFYKSSFTSFPGGNIMVDSKAKDMNLSLYDSNSGSERNLLKIEYTRFPGPIGQPLIKEDNIFDLLPKSSKKWEVKTHYKKDKQDTFLVASREACIYHVIKQVANGIWWLDQDIGGIEIFEDNKQIFEMDYKFGRRVNNDLLFTDSKYK